MEGILIVIGLLIVAGWAENKFSSPIVGTPAVPTTIGQMPMIMPTIGSPATKVLVPGDPSEPGEVMVAPGPAPVLIPSNVTIPTLGNSGGVMTSNDTSAPMSGTLTAGALDSIAAQQAAGGSATDKMIMTLPTGSQIWQTPNGNTYQVWPEDTQEKLLQAGVMI